MPPRKRNGKTRKAAQGRAQGSGGFDEDRKVSIASAPRGRSAIEELRYSKPVYGDSKRVKLRYYELGVGGTGTAGIVSGYVFSANGAYDPNITGAGHQPMGFDQLMVGFEQCTVLRSKISATMLSSGNAGCRAALYLSPDTTILSSPAQTIENGELVTSHLYTSTLYGAMKTLSLNCDVAAYFGRLRGRPREIVNDVTLSCTSAANPTEQVYFILSTWDPFASNTVSWFADVVLEFDVLFWEPRKQSLS